MKNDRDVGPTWEYPAAGLIWRILPVEGRLIVGEERDPSNRSASIFCIGLNDGAVIWRGVRPGESWWTGIETVHRGVVVLHEYPVPSMPDHRRIIAVDLRTGRKLWENGDLAFAFASGSTVYGSKELFDRRVFYELDLATGAVRRELPAGEAGELREPEAAWGPEVGFPLPAAEIPAAVAAAFGRGARIEPGETLTYDDIDIVNCYETTTGGDPNRALREHLFVVDASAGTVVHRDVVCDALARPAGTTFIRVADRVVYVKDRSRLRSFVIPARRAP